MDGNDPISKGITTPSTQAFSDVAAKGVALDVALSDHKHGMPANPGTTQGITTPVNQAFGDAAAIGNSADVALSNHRHGMPVNPGVVYGLVTGSDWAYSTYALINIPGLTVPLLANHTYEFEFEATLLESVVQQANFGVNYSVAGATIEACILGLIGTASQSERINTFNNATLLGYGSTTDKIIVIKGTVAVGANAGNLTIEGQASGGNTMTIRKGAYLKATVAI